MELLTLYAWVEREIKFRGLPKKNLLFTKTLPDPRWIFCLIMVDFCEFLLRWGELQSPGPLSLTPMIVCNGFLEGSPQYLK